MLKLLRSGAYVSHDDGHYRHLTPFNRVPRGGRAAARLPAVGAGGLPALRRSRRSPTRASGTRRTTSTCPRRRSSAAGGAERPATGVTVTGLSDQHAWVRTAPDADLEVGDWVGLGLSHPCTSFDKWQLIPLVEADGTVTDYIRTFF